MLLDSVGNFIKKYYLQDKKIVVGFSGGYDSMCLLDILSRLKMRDEFVNMEIIAAHFNHNWRGEESLLEQEVCRLFAASRNIEFYLQTADKNLKQTENDARIARYCFFEEALEEYDADAVFTAHNKDDNAETVLYRIIKGTGIFGLKGISEKRQCFYRPLLSVYRKSILEYCNNRNLTPNNDSSNANTKYKRNYIRLNVIPTLEKVNENVKEALNTLSIIANSENAIIDEYLSTIRPRVIKGKNIITTEFKKLSFPVKMRLLHEYIQILGYDYDYKRILEIADFIEKNSAQKNGSTISLSNAKWLYADENIVEMIPTTEEDFVDIEIPIPCEGEHELLNKIFVLDKYEEKEIFLFPEATSNFAYVDLSKVHFPLTLRTRREGDIISPYGVNGTMKLKKFFNSKGVPRHKRDSVLLLCSGNNILWAVGIGISNLCAVNKTPTHVLEIIEERKIK